MPTAVPSERCASKWRIPGSDTRAFSAPPFQPAHVKPLKVRSIQRYLLIPSVPAAGCAEGSGPDKALGDQDAADAATRAPVPAGFIMSVMSWSMAQLISGSFSATLSRELF